MAAKTKWAARLASTTGTFAFVVAVCLITAIVIVAAPAGSATPAWSIVASANPPSASTGALQQVSCPSVKSCFAVGGYGTGVVDLSLVIHSLVEHWNGSSWSIMPSPNPSGSTNTELWSVSCPSAVSCFSVGTSQVGAGSTRSLVERWNGKSWSIVKAPNTGGLYSVACPSVVSCFAVNGASAERWNGKSWSIVNNVGFGSVVACASTTNCLSVGASNTVRWNGKIWSVAAAPKAAGSHVLGLTCPSATSCFAVGDQVGQTGKSLVEHWNGKSWSIMPSPNPAGSVDALLFGVSCASPKSCFAVGDTIPGTHPLFTFTLVEHWNGRSWSIMPSPNLASDGASVLQSVACPSTTNCLAVGWGEPGSSPVSGSFAEQYR